MESWGHTTRHHSWALQSPSALNLRLRSRNLDPEKGRWKQTPLLRNDVPKKDHGVSRLDKIRNTKIRQSLGLKYNVIDKATQKRMRFFGHIKRMPQERYPKLLLEARLEGRRPKGRPAKRWMNCIRQNIKIGGMTSVSEAGRYMDRKAWQNIMDQMARQSEEDAPVPMR